MRKHVVAVIMIAAAAFLLTPASGLAQVCTDSFGLCSWLSGDVSISTGYWGGKGVDFSFSAPNIWPGSVTQLSQQYPMRGIGLDGLIRVRTPGPLGVTLGASYVFCFQSTSEETAQNAGTASLVRSWEAQLQSGSVDFAWTLTLRPSVTWMLGVRYENFQTNFLNPNAGFGTERSALNTANITVNAWNPYLGLVYCSALESLGLDFRVGVIGSPWVLGSVDYMELVSNGLQIGGQRVPLFPASNQIGQGYLVEFFGDCAVGYFRGIRLGAYGKYQMMRAVTNVNVGERNGNVPDVFYRFDFQKQIWGAGGSFTVFF